MRTVTFVSLLAVLGLFGSGCEPSSENIVNTTTEEPPATTETATATSDPMAGRTPGGAVEVVLIDRRIEMPATLPAGRTVFNVTNQGEDEHNFEIEGNGIERELPENLGAGESATLEVDLSPGTYRVYCPVGKHAEEGMSLQLTVTEPPATTTSV
ncbi:MAG TPA: cupredoxin domain-containing protein [Thermoanaerobaculia bacterium]|nr:cupredoxin domain-containing protein [Thermoanaerobaculia bacterium]